MSLKLGRGESIVSLLCLRIAEKRRKRKSPVARGAGPAGQVPRVPRMLLAFPWNPVLQLQLGPNLKFESIRPAALFIAFVNPATDCVFHLNGCCRELFGCLIRIAFHWNSFPRC